jgi:hypothetical protein
MEKVSEAILGFYDKYAYVAEEHDGRIRNHPCVARRFAETRRNIV